jgi:hypothetical protein
MRIFSRFLGFGVAVGDYSGRLVSLPYHIQVRMAQTAVREWV